MGCDIHLVIEAKHDGRWKAVLGDGGPVEEEPLTRFLWRNYRLFGILAGVRNTDLRAIAPPRGIPADVSPELSSESGRDQLGDHSFSWLSLREVVDYPWDQVDPDKAGDSFASSYTIAEHLGDFLGRIIVPAVSYAQRNALSHDEVRIVFGFDN